MREKRRDKGFYGRSKNISAKNNSTPTNSTPPALFRTSSLNNTLHIIVATKTFVDDQTPSISWLYITKTNMKQNKMRLQEITYPLWKRGKPVK